MDQFIITNISLLNKNNVIKIKIGKKIDDTIFDYTLSKKIIDIFIDNCRKKSIHFTKSVNSTIYKYLNNRVEITSGKANYYLYKTLDYCMVETKRVGLVLTTNNIVSTNIQSIHKYNSISYEEEYISNINNLFTITINNNVELDNYNRVKGNNYYTISIIIKKPNNHSKIINKIEEIITLIPTTI